MGIIAAAPLEGCWRIKETDGHKAVCMAPGTKYVFSGHRRAAVMDLQAKAEQLGFVTSLGR